MMLVEDQSDQAVLDQWNMHAQSGEELLLIRRLREVAGLSETQVVQVLRILDGTCRHCWDANSGCYCWQG